MKKIIRNLIDEITRFFAVIARIKKNRIPVYDKLNLGCGLAVTPGWLNIDGSFNMFLSKMPIFIIRIFYKMSGASRYYSFEDYSGILKNNQFMLYDLSFGLPFKNQTVQYIFTSHFLEHLEHNQAVTLLNDCYRVLKTAGKIRISIPDLEYAIKLYPKDKERMLQHYFFIDKSEGYHAQHKYMYDYEMIHKLLTQIGFKKVARYSFRKGDVPDIDQLDNRPEDSLFIEAEK